MTEQLSSPVDNIPIDDNGMFHVSGFQWHVQIFLELSRLDTW